MKNLGGRLAGDHLQGQGPWNGFALVTNAPWARCHLQQRSWGRGVCLCRAHRLRGAQQPGSNFRGIRSFPHSTDTE